MFRNLLCRQFFRLLQHTREFKKPRHLCQFFVQDVFELIDLQEEELVRDVWELCLNCLQESFEIQIPNSGRGVCTHRESSFAQGHVAQVTELHLFVS
jgi:hypothetical protein